MENTVNRISIRSTAAFVLLQVGVWALMSSRYFSVQNQPADWPGSLFAVLFAVGQCFLFGLALGLLLTLAHLLSRRRPAAADAVSLVLGTVFTGLLAVDVVVFTLFRMHLNPSLVGIFLAASPFEIYDPPLSFYIKAAGGLAFLVLAESGLLALSKRAAVQRWVPAAAAAGLLAVIAFNLMHAVAVFKVYPPILFRTEALPPSYVRPLSVLSLLRSLGVTRAEGRAWSRKEMIGASMELEYPKGSIRFTPPERPFNVIVILVDSWRMGSFTETVMPRLYARARAGLVFSNHWSGGNRTGFGVFSFLYGLPASYVPGFAAERRPPLLLETFRERGYDFGLYSSASFESAEFLQLSFTNLRDRAVPAVGATSAMRDQDMENRFRKFLDGATRPFFGFLFYDLLHSHDPFPDLDQPFSPACRWDYLEFGPDVDPRPYLNQYYNVAHTLDVHLAAMLDALKAAGRFEDTVIIITGDHAEEVNDTRTNTWGHHGSNFSRYQIQVPFIVFWPGRREGTVTYRTTHEDVARTLMEDVLGASPDDAGQYTTGRNLFDDDPREIFICTGNNESAIIHGDQVYVLKPYGLMQSYNLDLDGRESGRPLSPQLLEKALAEMTYFYRNGGRPPAD